MAPFRKKLSTLRRGLMQIAFPNVCLCCGYEALSEGQHICSFCLEDCFEDANPENELSSSGVIMPGGVILQHALWKFDKGGALQDLLHALKYEGLTGIGRQCGKALAYRAKKHPFIQQKLDGADFLQVPVPLHYLKFKKRGFNQAFAIARGVRDVLSIPICEIDAVRRKKYTLSQTGFSLEKRLDNMEDAFAVSDPSPFKDKTVIIVDDVFTTGATTFELSKVLKKAGAASVMIWTVAQA